MGATELFHLFKRLGNPISYERLVALFDKYDIDDSGELHGRVAVAPRSRRRQDKYREGSRRSICVVDFPQLPPQGDTRSQGLTNGVAMVLASCS